MNYTQTQTVAARQNRLRRSFRFANLTLLVSATMFLFAHGAARAATVSRRSSDILNQSPLLVGALGNYGGAPEKHALLNDSPAINAGNNCVKTAACGTTHDTTITLPTDWREAARAGNVDTGAFEYNPTVTRKAVLDFDGDGKSDYVVARAADANSQTFWLINNGAGSSSYVSFGLGVRGFGFTPPADIAVPADYDGDGKADVAVWRPTGAGDSSRSYFYILQSNGNTFRAEQLGSQGDNPTVIADYDGDGKADVAVYRDGANAGAQSYWFYRPSSAPDVNFRPVPWGINGDFVAPGDYDGDGKADFCVLRPTNGNAVFYLAKSDGSVPEYINFGLATDQINPGDYDGDGRTDFALTRNINGSMAWYILTRTGGGTGASPVYFGIGSGGDFTAQGDYDGDGKTDIAVWRRNDGAFYVRRSLDGAFQAVKWGQPGDYPVGYYNAH